MLLGYFFVALLALLTLFQLALIAGAPWGRFAWGGQYPGALPAKMRAASAASVLGYIMFAIFALDRSDIIQVLPPAVSQIGMWVIFAVLALSTLGNLSSKSKPERFVMTPLALVLTGLACAIAVTGPQ